MKKYIIFIIWATVITFFWLLSGYLMTLWWGTTNRGNAGDMFGAINALFSGLAFAGIIYTITMQREDLKLQRDAIKMQTDELKLQREETARSADQLESQRLLLNYQIIMSTVLELINIKNKKLSGISIRNSEGTLQGPSAITRLIRTNLGMVEQDPMKQAVDELSDSIFHILQFIHESDLTDTQKETLAKLLSADITLSEIFLIYYQNHGNQHRMTLLKKYKFDFLHNRAIELFNN